MPFPKGHKINKNKSNRKGKRNKKTIEQLEQIDRVLNLLEPNLEKDIKSLNPNERVRLWEALQEYKKPKLARVESEVSITTPLTVNFKPLDE